MAPFDHFSRAPSPTAPPSASPIQPSPRELLSPKRTHSPHLVFNNNHSIVGPYPSEGVYMPIESRPQWHNEQKSFFNGYNTQTYQRPPAVASFDASHNSGAGISSRIAQFQDHKRSRSPPLLSTNENNLRNSRNITTRPIESRPQWHNEQKSFFNDYNTQTYQRPPAVTSFDASHNSGAGISSRIAQFQDHKRSRSPPLLSTDENNLKNSRNITTRPALSDPLWGNQPNIPGGFRAIKRTRSPPSHSADQVIFENSNSVQDDDERELQAKAKRMARFKVELSQPLQSSPGNGNQKFSTNRPDWTMGRQKLMEEHSADMVGDLSSGNALSDLEAAESSNIITGLCPDMCPERERAERERKGDLDQYERLEGDRNQTSSSLAVKKYNRTAAREAELIRPMPVLQMTIDYLLNLLDQHYSDRFLGLYNFLWDRMRAIRMDLRMQHIFDVGAITMLEQMIRLHIVAMHELCEYTKGEGFSEGFDAHLNIEQMNKALVELFQLYDDHRKKGIKVPSEREFRGYYALLKLDKHPGYKVEPAELSLELSKMTPEIRRTPEVLFARDVARACRTGNFIAFFRLARKASYLQACLMHAHFAKLRTHALASLHCGLQNNKGIPVAHVAKWLGMEEEDIENLLEYHGFMIKEFEEPYMLKEGPFLNVDNDFPVKLSKLVDLKKSRRIVEDVSVSLSTEEVKELRLTKIYEEKPTPVQLVETGSSALAIDEEMPDYEAISSPKDATQVRPMLKKPLFTQQNGDNSCPVASVSPLSWELPFVHNSPKSQQTKVGTLEKPPNFDTRFRNSFEKNIHSETKAMPLHNIFGSVGEGRLSTSQTDSPTGNIAPQTKFAEDFDDEERTDITDIHQEVENDVRSYNDEEVAEARLKLILRIWRRHSSKKRQLRELRQLAANAALNSLSLGPPIRHRKDEPSMFGEFDIDRVMSQRYQKHERSWSRLNVSEVIAGELGRKNPEAKCHCWKIVLCSQMDNPVGEKLGQWSQATPLAPHPWLLSKLMPTGKDDDDLVISSPGLSVWKKWIPCQSGGNLTCCLSIIKDTKTDYLSEAVLGASAILFLVSESIPWELQKMRLHNLLMSLPSGSCLPLLILRGRREENSDSSSTVVENLGLRDIDKSRLSNFLVVHLVQNHEDERFDGFFSDEQLRDGLKWLASESPLPPVLSCVTTLEVVLTHLNSSLGELDEMNAYDVGPNHCISTFNEALDRSLGEIGAAANANPACWPCPEISLLEESSDEYKAVKLYLPSIGWSSAARIQPLASALKDCKIPAFPDDISWLYKGSISGEGIKKQIVQLENCLFKYLTQSSKAMGLALATEEAHVMLQKNARLELHNSSYYLVPEWMMIFLRIFNWRLMNLTNGAFSTAYILEQRGVDAATYDGVDKLVFKGSISSPPCYLIRPSLDEMVEACCSPLMSRIGYSEHEASQSPSVVGEDQDSSAYANDFEDEMNIAQRQNDTLVTNGSNYYTSSERVVVETKVTKEADKLSKLFEQCNILQDRIDNTLSIYF
ncbi:SAC3 family protein B isoform X2 [Cornus florida]|nr:SAC3 family protein B isoform X2 [Cornus florida]